MLRRRVVSAVTLVIGAILLAVGLRFPPGDPRFYYATLALAAVWIVGAFASGPLHLGHAWTRRGHVGRPVVQSLALATILPAASCAVTSAPARRQLHDWLWKNGDLNHLRTTLGPALVRETTHQAWFARENSLAPDLLASAVRARANKRSAAGSVTSS